MAEMHVHDWEMAVLDHKGNSLLPLRKGDTLVLLGIEGDHIVARVKKAPGPIRRLWRRFVIWTLR